MDVKNLNLKSSNGTKTPVNADRLSGLWQAIHTTTTEAYSSLREDLNRALEEYRLSNYEKAEAALRKLITYLDGEMAKAVPDAFETVQLMALRGAAYSVLGRVYERLGRKKEASGSFTLSIEMYRLVNNKEQAEAVAPPDYRDLGIALQKVGRLDEAIYILEQAIERGDKSVETYSSLGSILRDRGDLKEAQEYLRKVAELSPDDPSANIALAENLEALGQLDEAISNYMKAALSAAQKEQWSEALSLIERCNKLNPNNTRVLGIKAEVLRLWGHYQEALEALDHSLEVEPEDAFTLGMKGQVLLALDQNKEAMEVLEKAITAKPDLGWLHAELGEALRQLGHYEEALSAFDRALELEPENVLARAGRGALLTVLERYDEALEELDKLLEEEPDNAFALAYKGEVLRLTERYKEALQALDQSLEVEAEDAFVLGTKGQVLRVLNRNEEAVEMLGRAIRVDSSYGWAHAELGEALRLLGRNEEALHAFERGLEIEKDNPSILGSKGAALYAMRQYPEALEALNQSLAVMPDYAWALSLKSSILCDLGAFAEAVQTLEKIDEDNPPEILGYALSVKGWALEHLDIEDSKHAEDAKKAYEAALEADPYNFWSQKGVANSLYVLGHVEEAKTRYNQILETLKNVEEVDAHMMALKGWCLYRVDQHNDAMRRLVDALSLNPTIIFAQFDLALVSMDSARYGLGLREYDRALELLETEHVLRRRGLLHVALKDLKIAIKNNPSLLEADETRQALKMMQEEFEKTNATELPEGAALPLETPPPA